MYRPSSLCQFVSNQCSISPSEPECSVREKNFEASGICFLTSEHETVLV